MKAQLYDDEDYVRIFDTEERQAIMDCYSFETSPISTDAADLVLKRCKLRRTKPWKRYPHGHMWETFVSFSKRS